ncbi:MAG: glycosyltransferase family 2 protein [Corynebacteriales bacterium]|nr:glycosyltransferase family 2 protein [Mycobacteriales bacterium]
MTDTRLENSSSAGNVAISVVVVTYNSSAVIEASLAPLVGRPMIEVVVYDNASADHTVATVERLGESVTVITGTENVGFARAVNRAVRETRGAVVVLLNPDAVIAPADLTALADRVIESPLSVAAPLVVDPRGFVAVASAGRFPSVWRMFTHYFQLSKIFPYSASMGGHYESVDTLAKTHVTQTDWVSGACLVCTRGTWDRLDGLSERWFMYAEDIDFCWRIHLSGGTCLVDSTRRATHLVGESSGMRAQRADSTWLVNLYDFYCLRMATTVAGPILWRFVVVLGLTLRSLIFLGQSLVEPTHAAPRRRSARDFLAHARALATVHRSLDCPPFDSRIPYRSMR